MKYEIRNRWSGAVQFTAEIKCAADASETIKLGLAVRAAVNAGADLRGADLAGAYLEDADLERADLAGAYLAGACLVGAYLEGACLADAYLARANLAGANFVGAKIRDGIAIPGGTACRGGGAMTDRSKATTHAEVCWSWGPAHYECAVREIERLRKMHQDAYQRGLQAGDGCHCWTCTCNPNMTPAVRFDLSPAQQEGAIREHLIRLGWTPPDEHALSQPAAPSGTVNVVGMPEFDSLLDHIYEYGTEAEGVIEKANAFARAVIARYAPQQPAAADEEIMVNTPYDVFTLPLQPSGLSSGPRFVVHVPGPEKPVGVEGMQRRLDREESDHGRTIDQRDAAEDALGRMFQAVTGRTAEWSSAWGYVDAIEEVEEHVATLAAERDQLAAALEAARGDAEPVVRFNDDGTLDEVVGRGQFHLEQMGSGHWWMQLGPHIVNLSARGKIRAHFGRNEAAIDAAMEGEK